MMPVWPSDVARPNTQPRLYPSGRARQRCPILSSVALKAVNRAKPAMVWLRIYFFSCRRGRSFVPARDDIQRSRDWTERPTLAIATQRLADGFQIRAMLERERQDDRRVPCVGVGLIAGFVVLQKQLADPALVKAGNGRRETQAIDREFKRLAVATVWQAAAGGHHPTP